MTRKRPMSDREKLTKRIYSLAYHRATAALKEKHSDEFERLLTAHKANIRVELEMTGSIETTRGGVKHLPDENGEYCEECGKPAPCRWQLVREKNALEHGRSAAAAGSGGNTVTVPQGHIVDETRAVS